MARNGTSVDQAGTPAGTLPGQTEGAQRNRTTRSAQAPAPRITRAGRQNTTSRLGGIHQGLASPTSDSVSGHSRVITPVGNAGRCPTSSATRGCTRRRTSAGKGAALAAEAPRAVMPATLERPIAANTGTSPESCRRAAGILRLNRELSAISTTALKLPGA